MNMMLVKDVGVSTTEELLRKENVRLRMENAILREKLRCRDIGVDVGEMERQYVDYYRCESNEVLV